MQTTGAMVGRKNPLCLSDERNNAIWGDNSLLLARGLAPCVPKGTQHLAVWALCSAEQNPVHVQALIQASPNRVKHKGQAGMETAHTSVLCCSRLQYPHAIAVQTCIAEHWFLQVFTKKQTNCDPLLPRPRQYEESQRRSASLYRFLKQLLFHK